MAAARKEEGEEERPCTPMIRVSLKGKDRSATEQTFDELHRHLTSTTLGLGEKRSLLLGSSLAMLLIRILKMFCTARSSSSLCMDPFNLAALWSVM
jgi:hypothetical protein